MFVRITQKAILHQIVYKFNIFLTIILFFISQSDKMERQHIFYVNA